MLLELLFKFILPSVILEQSAYLLRYGFPLEFGSDRGIDVGNSYLGCGIGSDDGDYLRPYIDSLGKVSSILVVDVDSVCCGRCIALYQA